MADVTYGSTLWRYPKSLAVCMYSHCKGQLVDLGYTAGDGNDVFRCVECGAKQSIKGHRNRKAKA